jgi:hypothetical protein
MSQHIINHNFATVCSGGLVKIPHTVHPPPPWFMTRKQTSHNGDFIAGGGGCVQNIPHRPILVGLMTCRHIQYCRGIHISPLGAYLCIHPHTPTVQYMSRSGFIPQDGDILFLTYFLSNKNTWKKIIKGQNSETSCFLKGFSRHIAP